MKWSHLPVAGGLYDQHPQLLEDFSILFSERNKWQAEEQKKREAETERKSRGKGGRR